MSYFESAASQLELEFAALAAEITRNGFPFDVDGGKTLLAELINREGVLGEQLQQMRPPQTYYKEFIPKINNAKRGYVAGVPVMKPYVKEFNPNSSPQIYEWLSSLGCTFTVLTKGGQYSMSAAVLASLDCPEAVAIASFKNCDKIQTMLTGDKGWLTVVSADGRIHTAYNTLGTITGRCSHSPNVAQVPKVKRDANKQVLKGAAGHWGWECRALFHAPADWYLVGIDQSGLELRMLAHHLAPWDDGAYAAIACDNPHGNNADIIGSTREQAKTFVYAMIYGGGHHKLGTIIQPELDDPYGVCFIGAAAKAQLINGITGFRELFAMLDHSNTGYIEGLDGRQLFVRKPHARLNTLLQADGSIVCKRWALLTHAMLQQHGLHHGDDYQIVAHIHDELEIAARTHDIAELVAKVGEDMASEAGRYYNMQCPTAGEAEIGRTWADVH